MCRLSVQTEALVLSAAALQWKGPPGLPFCAASVLFAQQHKHRGRAMTGLPQPAHVQGWRDTQPLGGMPPAVLYPWVASFCARAMPRCRSPASPMAMSGWRWHRTTPSGCRPSRTGTATCTRCCTPLGAALGLVQKFRV